MSNLTQINEDTKYNIIYADPPWRYRRTQSATGKGAAELHYQTMEDIDIFSLDIQKISAKDCMLFLWVTMPCLDVGFNVIRCWGFQYITSAFVWVKSKKHYDPMKPYSSGDAGNDVRNGGCGSLTRSNAEICLLARKGHIVADEHNIDQVIFAPAGIHSAKPLDAYVRIEQLLHPQEHGYKCLELFSRVHREGWDRHGSDIGDIRELVGQSECVQADIRCPDCGYTAHGIWIKQGTTVIECPDCGNTATV